MKSHRKFKLLAIATAISLISSLSFTATAIADDAVPPATAEPVVIDESDIVAEPVVIDESVTTAEPLIEESSPTPSEILEQLSPDTEVIVVVDEQIEPLATQVAANIFVVGDPIWCPDGDAPTPGAGGCTATYTDLLSLVEDIDNGALVLPAENGTIWIEGGNDASSLLSDISIDGSNPRFATLSNYSLTLQGGWDGVSGSYGTPGTSVFFVPISILNWNAPVTINQITSDGHLYGASSTGLEIQTTGDVTLNNFSSIENGDLGLSVEAGGDIDAQNMITSLNGSGAALNSLGSITLMGVNAFEDNLGNGFVAEAVGDIDIEAITASGNGAGGTAGNGAELTSTSGNVTLAGVFEDNLDTGLFVESFGDIDIQDITASGNGAGGVTGKGAELYSTSGVTLTGIFENNLESGLYVEAAGDIAAVSIIASGNGAGGVSGSGAELNSLSSVFLAGTNVFDNNYDVGLFIDAVGDVNLENVAAGGNTTGAELNLLGSLSLTGTNVFSNNNETGLYVEAAGGIDAENLTASQNGLVSSLGNGAELYTLGGFYLAGTNVFSGNHDTGLYVEASGDIDAENVTANDNGSGGGEFYTLGSFTLSGTNVFNNNGLDGLFVSAVGTVSIENTDAKFNGGNGITIEGNGNASITCGLLNNNGGYEIEADLPGTLTLNGVDFDGNIDVNLGVDEDQLVLVSNGCFKYPRVDDNGGSDNNSVTPVPPLPVLPIHEVIEENGQIVKLDCVSYRGTRLIFSKGGAYLPCPVMDSVRLIKLPSSALPDELPDGTNLVSSFHLAIMKDGQIFEPFKDPGSVWYVDISPNVKNLGSQVVFWNGLGWVDITDQINPFMSVFFAIPDTLKDADLAILYWDGTNWIELSDNQYFGDGRIVQSGGFSDNGFFQATVNFIGTFALVEK